jgi:type IV pilus assembly protein PilW
MRHERQQREQRYQAGFSLIEVVVAMAIGLLVVGAVLATYLSASQGQRVQASTAQMDEDAQIALRLLSSELMQAGYSAPVGLLPAGASPPGFARARIENPLLECGSGPLGRSGACADPPPNNQMGIFALVVRYEATHSNTSVSDNWPTDCLGSSLRFALTNGRAIVTNRYYLSNSAGVLSLQCLGSALSSSGVAISSAPLVSNIESLRLWYGQANGGGITAQPVRHVPAAELAGNADAAFARIVSVRICVIARSADAVAGLDASVLSSYLDCDLRTQISTDRRLRRAYFTTVALRNLKPF